MQLSLPVLSNPAAVLPPPTPAFISAGDEGAPGAAGAPAAEAGAMSFEEFFSKDAPVLPGGAKPEKSGMEDAAAALAASLWQPGAPPAPLPPESPPVAAAAVPNAAGPATGGVEARPWEGPAMSDPVGQNPAPGIPPVPAYASAQARPPSGFGEMPAARAGTPPENNLLKQPLAAVVAEKPATARKPFSPDQPLIEAPAPVEDESSFAATPSDVRPPVGSQNIRISPPASGKTGETGEPVTEKIAGLDGPLAEAGAKTVSPEEKEILSAAHKTVAAAPARLGTAVADWVQPMPSAPSSRPKPIPVTPTEVPVAASGSFSAHLTVETAAPVATLREVLATVVSAVTALEQRADIQPKHVDFHFRVGDEPMSLRVELKAGTVHTIFQTGSDELRAALSREWGALVPPSVAAHLRLADPVFHAPSDGGSGSTFGSTGQGGTPQRGQPGPEPLPFSRSAAPDETQQPESPAASSSASPGLTLLNAFA
ncbi:MAG: hypothetical protein HYX71_12610 [Opitutae bacterium]|nr:hypothetical protein [Opitutae bacterium]